MLQFIKKNKTTLYGCLLLINGLILKPLVNLLLSVYQTDIRGLRECYCFYYSLLLTLFIKHPLYNSNSNFVSREPFIKE